MGIRYRRHEVVVAQHQPPRQGRHHGRHTHPQRRRPRRTDIHHPRPGQRPNVRLPYRFSTLSHLPSHRYQVQPPARLIQVHRFWSAHLTSLSSYISICIFRHNFEKEASSDARLLFACLFIYLFRRCFVLRFLFRSFYVDCIATSAPITTSQYTATPSPRSRSLPYYHHLRRDCRCTPCFGSSTSERPQSPRYQDSPRCHPLQPHRHP